MAFKSKTCPAEPKHGPVIDWPGNPKYGWRCPDQEHDGRPASHPLGAAPITRSLFTTKEVDDGKVSDG